jgi:AraC-like DNA-binding protein
MEDGSVSLYFVHSALEPVLARGHHADELLRAAGIPPALLQQDQGRVSTQQFSALWLAVAQVLDDELFGQDSRRMKVGSFAMLAHSLVPCATLEQALQRMVRFFNLLLDDFHCSLECDERHARLAIRNCCGGHAAPILGYETLLMMQHGLACWLVGRRIPVLAATFAYPEPPRSAEYPHMYSAQLRFSQEATTLAFERSCLALPVIQDERSVKDFLRHAPANIVLKYKNSSGLAARIRRHLRATCRTDWPDFETFAHSLNLTPSTLRRRLEDEGQSFQGIKDQLRRDMAVASLRNSAKSMAEVAFELGFSEASAFQRAFKKWTGASPAAYRLLTKSASDCASSGH